jgi:hypothetical protein
VTRLHGELTQAMALNDTTTVSRIIRQLGTLQMTIDVIKSTGMSRRLTLSLVLISAGIGKTVNQVQGPSAPQAKALVGQWRTLLSPAVSDAIPNSPPTSHTPVAAVVPGRYIIIIIIIIIIFLIIIFYYYYHHHHHLIIVNIIARSYVDRALVMCNIVHSADLGATAKHWVCLFLSLLFYYCLCNFLTILQPLCEKWTLNIMDEFYAEVP